jgi:hypothetical protein
MTRVPEALDALLGRERVRVVDVGARGGWPRKWQTMRPWVTLIVSNPRPMSLNASGTQLHAMKCTWLMSCIGRTPRSSSITPGIPSVARSTGPNRALIQRLRPGDDRLDVVRSESIPVTTLDNALERAGIRSIDFLKLDTQGSGSISCTGVSGHSRAGCSASRSRSSFCPCTKASPSSPMSTSSW